jgi:hypothetical protein
VVQTSLNQTLTRELEKRELGIYEHACQYDSQGKYLKSEHCRSLIKEGKCQLRPAETNEYSISCANKIVYAPGERRKSN